MNVNTLEQHRSIMSTLGIDIWIPKLAETRHYKTSMYRDQVSEGFQESQKPLLDFNRDAKHEDIQTQPVDRTPQANSLARQLEQPTVIQKRDLQISQETVDEIENSEPIVINPFEIQAMQTSSCLILVDTTDLNAAQENLWLNIQRSMASQKFDLKWPFNFNQFQDGRGVQTYLQGFIDCLALDKKILSLGQIPHLLSNEITVVANLEEMLAEPLLKRQLWNLMKN